MSVMGIGQAVSAALGTYLNGINQARPGRDASRNKIGEFMRQRVLRLQTAVLRHLAVPGLALMIGIGRRARPERRPRRPGSVRQTRRQFGRCRQGQPAQDRRIRRGGASHQWSCGEPGMRLARPAGRSPDVARRPRHRLSPPRSLRPVRLPRWACPGHVPLPDPVWCANRRQGAKEPGRPGSRLLDQSQRPAPDRGRGDPGSRPSTAGNAASAPAAAPPPAAHQPRRQNSHSRLSQMRFFKGRDAAPLKTPRRHTSC